MAKIISGEKIDDVLNIGKISDDSLEEKIREIVKEKPGLRANAYMGMVIAGLGPNIDKRKAMEILQKIVKSSNGANKASLLT